MGIGRRRTWRTVVLGAVLSASIGGASAAPAGPVAAHPGSGGTGLPARYSTTRPAPADQCALPLAQRTGGWSC